MPFFSHNSETDGVILTKRSSNLKSHPGQISFPGGTLDKSDSSILDCALREWKEEMGSDPAHLKVHGRWEGYETKTGFHITPFVATYQGNFLFQTDPREVEMTILLPLATLQDVPFFALVVPKRSPEQLIFYFDLPEGLLWGATCDLLVRFLRSYANFNRLPKLVSPNLPQPPFLNPKLL